MSTLVGHFGCLPEKGRREIKCRRDSRGKRQGRKENEWKRRNRINKHSPSTFTCCKDSRPCPTVSQYQLNAPATYDTRCLCLTRPPPNTDNILPWWVSCKTDQILTTFSLDGKVQGRPNTDYILSRWVKCKADKYWLHSLLMGKVQGRQILTTFSFDG